MTEPNSFALQSCGSSLDEKDIKIKRLQTEHQRIVGELATANTRIEELVQGVADMHRLKVDAENDARRFQRQVDKLIDCLPRPAK